MAIRLRSFLAAPTRSWAVSSFQWNSRTSTNAVHNHRTNLTNFVLENQHPRFCPLNQTFPNSRCASTQSSSSEGTVDDSLNKSLLVVEETSAESLAAIREFELVNRDLEEAESERDVDDVRSGKRRNPMCYYFTQGLCTLVYIA